MRAVASRNRERPSTARRQSIPDIFFAQIGSPSSMKKCSCRSYSSVSTMPRSMNALEKVQRKFCKVATSVYVRSMRACDLAHDPLANRPLPPLLFPCNEGILARPSVRPTPLARWKGKRAKTPESKLRPATAAAEEEEAAAEGMRRVEGASPGLSTARELDWGDCADEQLRAADCVLSADASVLLACPRPKQSARRPC